VPAKFKRKRFYHTLLQKRGSLSPMSSRGNDVMPTTPVMKSVAAWVAVHVLRQGREQEDEFGEAAQKSCPTWGRVPLKEVECHRLKGA
jgi:hypothetical protein